MTSNTDAILSDPALFEIVAGEAKSDATDISDTARARMAFYAKAVGETANEASPDDLTRLVAAEIMQLIDTHTPDEVGGFIPQMRVRAASTLRARSEPSPSTLGPVMPANVDNSNSRLPYVGFFAVREDDISFPLFSGGRSPTVTRASLIGGDAVTVLPYDPKRDAVLLVRQFRHGPYARGDGNPWTLEPSAGRIDPGEDPEETARRELLEETGVTAGDLHFIARYYPTPGAFSEYLFSYVALADLSSRDRDVGGLATEAEDIMAHVIPLTDALAMIGTGEINTGPLIMSLQWLAAHKASLTG